MTNSISYRPEIDGLRALAVILVVLYHAHVPGFSNGFIGVDIFFVISGFLITSIIAQQHSKKNFVLGEFIVRRVRRILPALAVVMLACIPFAYWLMLPDPLENFGQSLIATSVSANNILLWLTSGYWDLESEYKPLLHTWSLGVEEQYYVIYPIVLILFLRRRFWWCCVGLLVLAIMSFCSMLVSLSNDESAAFYLLHNRAWQFLLGGLSGILALKFGRSSSTILSAFGLTLILVSLCGWLGEGLPMAVTLASATVGTCLFIFFANEKSVVSWAFTQGPVVFVGLISYSFYLWHQPIFAYLRIGSRNEPNMWMYGAGIALAVFLSVLSWRFVEKPMRSPKKTSPILLSGFLAVCLGTCMLVGVWFYSSAGVPHRLGNVEASDRAGATIAYNERIRSMLATEFSQSVEYKPTWLIVGNSFARDFANVLIEADLDSSHHLIYMENFPACPSGWSAEQYSEIERVDFVIFASGSYRPSCVLDILKWSETSRVEVLFVGPKHFGQNLNPILRISPNERHLFFNLVPQDVLERNAQQSRLIGSRYINLLSVLMVDEFQIRVTDDHGTMMTTDRVHFSRAGAIYIANRLPSIVPEIYDDMNNAPHENSRDDG